MADLAEVMREVAARLRTERQPPVETTLEAITAAAVQAVPGAADAGVSFVSDRSRIEARVATGDRPTALDVLQDRPGDGPCYAAIREDEVVHAPDVATEQRWPGFAAAARIFAVHAAIALAAAEREEHLEVALRSRDRIGQAKGILMERYKLTPDQAFALLVRTSSITHRKLKDIADELATTGAFLANPGESPQATAGARLPDSGQHPDTG
jgi:hypothetical protein